jgi:predicted ATPase
MGGVCSGDGRNISEIARRLPCGALAVAAEAREGLALHPHDESFLAVMINRFGADGLYLLDEPEAALSPQNCLTCLRRIHELVTRERFLAQLFD